MSRSSSESDFTVYMNEGERHQIEEWVKKFENIETGGDLFGAWIDEHTAVVQFVLGPGKGSRRTSVSFYQDINYLRDAGGYLTKNHGLCNIGQWHSHHRLGITRPSGGDENTVWGNMPSLGLNRYIVFIATITGGFGSYHYSTSSYDDGEELKVNINPYLFEIKNGYRRNAVPHGTIEDLPGNSPFRLDRRIQDTIKMGAESINKVKTSQKRPPDNVSYHRTKKPKPNEKSPLNSGNGEADKSENENTGQQLSTHPDYREEDEDQEDEDQEDEDQEDEDEKHEDQEDEDQEDEDQEDEDQEDEDKKDEDQKHEDQEDEDQEDEDQEDEPNNDLKDQQEQDNSQQQTEEDNTDVYEDRKDDQKNNKQEDDATSEQQARNDDSNEKRFSATQIVHEGDEGGKREGEESVGSTGDDEEQQSEGIDSVVVQDSPDPNDGENASSNTSPDKDQPTKDKDQPTKQDDPNSTQNNIKNEDQNTVLSETKDERKEVGTDEKLTSDGSDNLSEECAQHQSQNTVSTGVMQEGDSDGTNVEQMNMDIDSYNFTNGTANVEDLVGICDEGIQLGAEAPAKENNGEGMMKKDTGKIKYSVVCSLDTVEQHEETKLLEKGSEADKTMMTAQTDDKNDASLVAAPEQHSTEITENSQKDKQTEKPENKDGMNSVEDNDPLKVIAKPSMPSPTTQGNGLIRMATEDNTNKYTQSSTNHPNITTDDTKSELEDHSNKNSCRTIFDPIPHKGQELKSENKTNISDTMTEADDLTLTAKEAKSESMNSKGEEIDVPNKTTEVASTIEEHDPKKEGGEEITNGDEKEEAIEKSDPEEKERAFNTNQNNHDVDASEQSTSRIQNPKKKKKGSKIFKKSIGRKSKDKANKKGDRDEDLDASEPSASEVQNPKKRKRGSKIFKKSFGRKSKDKDKVNKKDDKVETIEKSDPEEKERASNTNQNNQDVDASEQSTSEIQNPKRKKNGSKIFKKSFGRKSKDKESKKDDKVETIERSDPKEMERGVNTNQNNQNVDESEPSTSEIQNPKRKKNGSKIFKKWFSRKSKDKESKKDKKKKGSKIKKAINLESRNKDKENTKDDTKRSDPEEVVNRDENNQGCSASEAKNSIQSP